MVKNIAETLAIQVKQDVKGLLALREKTEPNTPEREWFDNLFIKLNLDRLFCERDKDKPIK